MASNKYFIFMCLLGALFFGGVEMICDERYKEGNVRIPSGWDVYKRQLLNYQP